MKLSHLSVRYLPGIYPGFDISFDNAPMQLILGPNGSGKSSICRLLQSFIWKEDLPPGHAEATWTEADAHWTSTLDGSVRWKHNGVQADPEGFASELRSATYLQLRDLLSATDESIATAIIRQMSGGYDLHAWGREILPPGKKMRSLRFNALRDARKELATQERRHHAVEERAERIPELKQRRKEARGAAEKLTLIDLAIEHAMHTKALDDIHAELSHFPAEISNIHGNEAEQLESRIEQLNSYRIYLKKTREELKETVALASRYSGLPSSPQVSLDILDNRLREAEKLRNRYESANIILIEKKQRLLSAAEKIHATDSPPTQPPPELINTISEIDNHRAAAQKKCDGIKVELSIQKEAAQKADPERLSTLNHAAALLRNWDSIRRRAPAKSMRWPMYASALVGVSALLAAIIHRSWLFYPSMTAFTLCAYLIGSKKSEQRPPSAEFSLTGLTPPENWEPSSVRQSLVDIEPELTMLSEADDAAKRRPTLMRQLELSTTELVTSDNELRDICAKIGLTQLPSPLPAPGRFTLLIENWINAIDLFDEAKRISLEHKNALEQRLDPILKEISAISGGTVSDLPEAETRLNDLRTRQNKAFELTQKRETLERSCRETEERITTEEAQIQKIILAAGLPSGIPVEEAERNIRSLIEKIPEYKKQTDEMRRISAHIKRAEERLGDNLSLTEESIETLKVRREELFDLSHQLESLTEQITTLESEIRETASGNTFELAIAEEDRADNALREYAAAEAQAVIDKTIVQYVISSYETLSRPPLLRRAEELFSRFTHGAYSLRASENDSESASFIAIDTTRNRSLPLHELSDGTRIQLILAVRLAYIEQHESNATLPLFVDEALTTSDPLRFNAIAGTLAEIARERQLFYFTSDPSDIERIKSVCSDSKITPPGIINLAEIRNIASAAESSQLSTAIPTVPKPAHGMDPAEYARIIHVTAPLLHQGINQLDLFFLLRDNLPLLYHLRTIGISNIGRFKAFSRNALLKIITDDEICYLEGMTAIAKVVHSGAIIGNPPHAEREDLEKSEAVSETFIDPLTEMLREHNGDAADFLGEFKLPPDKRDPRTKRFSINKLNQLNDYFEENGYIDPRKPAEINEILAETLTLPDIQITPDEITMITRHIWNLYGELQERWNR